MLRVIAWAIGLIVVAVVIAGLLLPAVQSARESARRGAPIFEGSIDGSLSQKQKQIGIALRGHHDSYQKFEADVPDGAKGAPDAGEGGIGPRVLDRKIIYSATLDLVVEDFAGMPEKVSALVKKFDAYVANSNLSGSAGGTRRGTWKIRVPVARFEDFAAAAKDLGELVNAGTSSNDVSEEYYDVEARIRNKTKEEERLLKLLEERPGKLEDVIAIERELSRVREELERIQGRMRMLADLTSLTTADLTITEIHNYKPEDAPTLATRARRSFDLSLSALSSTGANTVVAAVAVVPWLPVLAVAIGMGYGAVRISRRRPRSPIPTKDAP